MSSTRYYNFKFSNGENKVMTLDEAKNHLGDQEIRIRFEGIILASKNKRMKKDGFVPGWQENIQMYCGGRQEYNQKLKELGLVEVGYDYIPQDSTKINTYCRSEEFIKDCMDEGITFTGSEVEAIKSGEYFKDSDER